MDDNLKNNLNSLKTSINYFLNRNVKSPRKVMLINLGLITVFTLSNIFFQEFCQPVNWVIPIVLISFLSIIIYPIISNRKLNFIVGFSNGISFSILVYLILFTNTGEAPILLYFLFHWLLIPIILALQLIGSYLIYPLNSSVRIPFVLSVFLCVVSVIFISQNYTKALNDIRQFKESDYTELNKTYWTEKILGMHFKYHTRFCEYDGWRPPLHDPILVIGLGLTDFNDPLEVDLKTRLSLYKQYFPELPYKMKCSCALQYNTLYHEDKLWK